MQTQSLLRLAISLLAALLLFATAEAASSEAQRTLYFLSLRHGVQRVNIGDTQSSAIAKEGAGPDGIAIDAQGGHVYWTNMGKVKLDDGSVMRVNLDGSNLTTIVPAGGTFTPKQLKLDLINRKLYWSDREGMRVMRANLDGTQIETLVIAGSGDEDRRDASHWCVGIAVDTRAGKFYWSQKGGDNAHQGSIKRANIKMPAGEEAAHRSDIETLFSDLPEPIDIDIDEQHQTLYWTDRGDNTISRAPLDPRGGFNPAARADRKILVRGLKEAIGIALDVKRNRMYYTDLGGNVGSATLAGKDAHMLLTAQGPLTGIALLDRP